jgi:hypothetical protein
MQKLLFLTMKLANLRDDRQIELDFEFRPERYGPADLNVYQDLEFLAAGGLIAKMPDEQLFAAISDVAPSRRDLAPEEMAEDELSFEYLMGNEDEAAAYSAAENRSEVGYLITDLGENLIKELIAQAPDRQRNVLDNIVASAVSVRKDFGHWPLPRLLRYVYTEYPEMTTNSEIKRQVLGHD